MQPQMQELPQEPTLTSLLAVDPQQLADQMLEPATMQAIYEDTEAIISANRSTDGLIALVDNASANGARSIVAAARHDRDPVHTPGFGGFLAQYSGWFCAFMEFWHLVLGEAAGVQQWRVPAAFLNIHPQCPGRV